MSAAGRVRISPSLAAAAGLVLLLAAWEALVRITALPPFILPGPTRVLATAISRAPLLAEHALITAAEITLGMLIGSLFGAFAALALARYRGARAVLLPLLITSQAVPVFALAPLLVLWLGYGMASKVAMASLIIFFPVAAAFQDGLRRTDPALLDQARSMGASPFAELMQVRLPSALPAFASGLRVAAAVAPIGAVIGEWVGSSAGLGYLMLHANGRMQTDLMFAALIVLAAMGLALWALTDRLARRLAPWARESLTGER